MADWTVETVLALAPDAASASAGQGLANIRKWSSVGASERAIWGLCQGSGKDPYQARVDLREPAFKCSCPSRKFPCKHGLGLFVLYAKERAQFGVTAEPGWVREWLEGREQRSEKKAEKAKSAAEAPVDLEAQTKRAAARDKRVGQGVAECRTWLDDLVRRGLAAAKSDPGAEWERVAARMVDAQASGLAGFIRRIPSLMASGAGWEVRTLEHLGRLHLLLEAANRIDSLPEELRGDVRGALGYSQSKEDVLAGQGVADRWTIIGQAFEEEDRLVVRRTWLCGQRTARLALVLDFAAGAQPLDTSLVPGHAFDGELAFYPSAQPLRALVKNRSEYCESMLPLDRDGFGSIESNLARYAMALGRNPWVAQWPMVLARTVLVRSGESWLLRQGECTLPISPRFARGMQLWRLLSVTGGSEATIVAEWDGDSAEPVGVFLEGNEEVFVSLASRWAA